MQNCTGSIPCEDKHFLSLKIFLHHSGSRRISIIREKRGNSLCQFRDLKSTSLNKNHSMLNMRNMHSMLSVASRSVAPDDAPKLGVKTKKNKTIKQRIFKALF